MGYVKRIKGWTCLSQVRGLENPKALPKFEGLRSLRSLQFTLNFVSEALAVAAPESIFALVWQP